MTKKKFYSKDLLAKKNLEKKIFVTKNFVSETFWGMKRIRVKKLGLNYVWSTIYVSEKFLGKKRSGRIMPKGKMHDPPPPPRK